jgi:hypothetical protein
MLCNVDMMFMCNCHVCCVVHDNEHVFHKVYNRKFLMFVVMVNKVFLESKVDCSSMTYSPSFQCDNL